MAKGEEKRTKPTERNADWTGGPLMTTDSVSGDTDSLPALLSRAGQRLLYARTSAQVLEAKRITELALHYAKVTVQPMKPMLIVCVSSPAPRYGWRMRWMRWISTRVAARKPPRGPGRFPPPP